MKKIYLLFILLPFFNLTAQIAPTCSLDPVFINSKAEGIWPDSAINFMSGTVGQVYLQNVTVVIPYDTVVSGLGTIHYSHVDLQASSTNYGLPPGLKLTGTPSTFKFPGNDSSCMAIYGTSTATGTFPLTFILKVYSTEFGNSVALTTYTVGYYKITIAPAAGISTNKNNAFQLMQNYPNPVISNNTVIKYSSPAEGKAKICVYNITGLKESEKEFSVQRGDNNYELDASTLENGIYLYSLELNGQKQIRRMVVAK
jgi:hypothetical protein